MAKYTKAFTAVSEVDIKLDFLAVRAHVIQAEESAKTVLAIWTEHHNRARKNFFATRAAFDCFMRWTEQMNHAWNELRYSDGASHLPDAAREAYSNPEACNTLTEFGETPAEVKERTKAERRMAIQAWKKLRKACVNSAAAQARDEQLRVAENMAAMRDGQPWDNEGMHTQADWALEKKWATYEMLW